MYKESQQLTLLLTIRACKREEKRVSERTGGRVRSDLTAERAESTSVLRRVRILLSDGKDLSASAVDAGETETTNRNRSAVVSELVARIHQSLIRVVVLEVIRRDAHSSADLQTIWVSG